MIKVSGLKSRFQSMPLMVRASAVYLFVSIVQKGLAFLTAPIFTRIMSSTDYGLVSVYNSLEQLIGTVAMFCLSAGCFDIGMQDYKTDRDTFCYSLLILSNGITLALGALFFFLYPYIQAYLELPRSLFVVMFLTFLLSPAFTFWTRRERFEYRYKYPAIVTLIGAVASSLLAVSFVLFSESDKVFAKVLGSFMPFGIIYVIFWIYVAKKARFTVKSEYMKFAFLFNLPLIPHYLSSYVLSSSDRLMINYLVGASQAAYYSLSYNITSVMLIIWAAINSSLVPYVLSKYETKDYKTVSDRVLPILTAFAVMCGIVIAMAPEIIGILGTSEYKEAIYIVPPVVGGVFFQALYYIFTNVLYYLKKPSIVMYASITSALVNIILNYVCIKKFGYIAAGYTTLICYMLQAIIDYVVAKHILGENIYDMRYLLFLCFIMIVVVLLFNLIYPYTILRYFILMAGIVFLIIKKDVFLGVLKKDMN